MYYEKTADSKKNNLQKHLFNWAFDFWGQKPKPKAQPNRPIVIRKNWFANSLRPFGASATDTFTWGYCCSSLARDN